MKLLRGQILDFLKRIYPREIEELEILSVFYQYYKDVEIQQSLAYLVDKGYVEARKVSIYNKKKQHTLYKLSPKGIDLLERTIEDPAIIIPEG